MKILNIIIIYNIIANNIGNKLNVAHGRCVAFFWTTRQTTREHALQSIFERFPEVSVEVGIYQRVQ